MHAGAVLAAADPDEPTVEEVVDSVRSIGQTAIDAGPRLGLALGVVVVGWLLSRLLRMALRAWWSRTKSPSFAVVMSKLAGWLLLGLAVLAATAVAFPSVKPVDILASLGFFSVAVGFAFRDILENTLSGVLLLLRQPFRSGDQIHVADQAGTVKAITVRETQLLTFAGELVLIPNRDVYKSVLIIPTHYPTRRLAFTVGIAYENDAAQAVEVLTAAMRGVADVDDERSPEALVVALGVSTVDVEVRIWCSSRELDGTRVLSAAIVAAKAALEQAGIEMPADIVVLQATPSFKAALQGEGDVTPGGAIAR
ncbi:MAG: mechanosensitive ion channel domain-containing protein [Candidatus Nanopelagicales bacterium]